MKPCLEALERRQLLSAGAVDTSFGALGRSVTDFATSADAGQALAVLADGKFIIAGESAGQFAVAKYNADGSPDTGFGTGGSGRVTTSIGTTSHASSVAIDGSGRIVVGGWAQIGTQFDFALARYEAGGTLDSSFGTGGIVTTDFATRNDYVRGLIILPTGEIVAAGEARLSASANSRDFAVARYNPADGSLDTSFSSDGKATTDFGDEDSGYAVAYDAATSGLVIAGESNGDFALARFAPGGTLDNTFDANGRVTTDFTAGAAAAMTIVIDSGGNYLAGGHAGGDFALARYTSAGALDVNFDTDGRVTLDFAGGTDVVNGLLLQTTGEIVAAGVASQGATGDFALARFTSAGAPDSSFGAGTGKLVSDIAGNADSAAAVAIQPLTDKILVAGTGNGGATAQDDFAAVRYEPVAGDVWANDTWVVALDQGATGLSVGDIVENTGSGDAGPTVSKTFGFDAFTSIGDAIDEVAAGGTVHVLAGTYTENVIIDKSLTLRGQSQGNTTLHPATSAPDPVPGGGSLPGGESNVILVRADNVTIRTMLIDGDRPAFGDPIDARNGIITDHVTMPAITNVTVHDVTVRNTFFRGIEVSSTAGSFNLHHNTISHVTNAAGAGVALDNGTATIADNAIFDNPTGVLVTSGGAATITNNDFDDADDNQTDLRITASAPGGIAGGAVSGNQFAGDALFIDNDSTQDFAALTSAGNTFDETSNFRIEDRVAHAMDESAVGLVSWIANNLYVTDPAIGAPSSDSSIQGAIDSASPGDTVNVEAGTYAQSVNIDKRIALMGAGSGSGAGNTIITGAGAAAGITISASGASASERLTVKDLRISGTGDRGITSSAQDFLAFINVASVNNSLDGFFIGDADDITMGDIVATGNGTSSPANIGNGIDLNGVRGAALTNINASDNHRHGLSIVSFANSTGASSNIQITGGTFSDNGGATDGSSGISLFVDGSSGASSITNVTIAGAITANNNTQAGIVAFNADPAAASSIGNVQVGQGAGDNVNLSNHGQAGVLLFGAVSNVSITADFDRGAATAAGVAVLGQNASGLNSPSGASIEDSAFVNYAAATPAIILASDSVLGQLISTGTVAVSESTINAFDTDSAALADHFAIENLIVHGVDVPSAGFVRWNGTNVYITPASFAPPFSTASSLGRAIAVAAAGDTVHVADGTYDGGVVVNKSIALLGDGMPTVGFGVFGGGGASGAFQVAANDVTIDGFDLSGAGGGADNQFGVLLLQGFDGATIRNSTVGGYDNAIATETGASGATDAIIENNTFGDTEADDYVIKLTAGSGHIVRENQFNSVALGIQLDSGVSNVTIGGTSAAATNTFTTPGSALVAANSTNANFIGNTITGATGHAVVVGASNTNLQIDQNSITGGAAAAVRIDSGGGAGSSAVGVNNNFLSGNQFGIDIAAGSLAGALDAQQNDFSGNSGKGLQNATTNLVNVGTSWWGSASASVVQTQANGGVDVDFNPWAGTGSDSSTDKGFQPDPGNLISGGLSISGAATVDEGSVYTLTLVDDGTSGTITGWTIDWGDGPPQVVSGNPSSVTHTYADGPSTPTISASATNDQSQTMTATSTVAVTVGNIAPAPAIAGSPASSPEGTAIDLTSTENDPGTGDTFTYAWSVTKNGNPFAGATTDNFSFTPDDNGTYVVSLTVTDDDGGMGSAAQQTITVTNVAPTVAINGAPASSPEGTALPLTSGVIDPGSGDTFTYAWSVTKNGNPFGNATTQDFTFTPDDNGTYVVSLTVTDDDAGEGTAAQQTIDVTNVAPRIAASGNASVNEGSTYTLNLGAITDPGDDTVTRFIINWGDGAFEDITADPSNTMHAHAYADGPAARNITISLFDEDASPHPNAGDPDPFVVNVVNVNPTATFFNGGTVPEGSNGLVGFAAQIDPSVPDTTAGFRYSYDFNNDGDFADSGEFSDVTNASVGVPAIYLADGPGTRTVRGRIKDKDGGFNDYTSIINIVNVTPFVNAGPDINTSATVPIVQLGNFSDPGADSPWTAMVDYDWHTGDNDAVPLTLSGLNFTLNHTYGAPGTYVIRVFVTDKDNASGFDDVTVNVGGSPSLQVNQFLLTASGFTLRFNRAIDTDVLNLYDGLDGITPSSEPADITLVGASGGPVRGSLAWNPATNILTFVRSGGPLLPDTYTLVVRSAANALQDPSGNLLDGNADNTPGDNYTNNFSVAPTVQRTLSIPDFARGPDSSANINVPNTSSLGLPVRIDDGSQVRSIDFTINYDPALLSLTDAMLAPGMPADWSITKNMTTAGTAIITVFGTSSDLPPGPREIVKLVARVPDAAPYRAAGVLRISNITVSRNDATTISTRGDFALQKVVYFGDVDADRAYTGFDAALISRVVVGLDSGFHELGMTDPVISADIDSSTTVTGIDASFVAQKSASLPRPEIPDLPPNLPPPVPGGIDPFISVPANHPGRPGGTTTLPITIDDATNTLGYNVTLDYDTALLDVEDDNMGTSPAVRLGELYQTAGGWTIVANVDDAAGNVRLVFWRTNGIPMPSGSGEIAEVDFDLMSSITDGTVLPIDVDGTESVGGLMFTYGDGSIRADATRPTVLGSTYTYQTRPHKISFEFSEDVEDSLVAGDFVVENLTTSTTIPASDFTLSYETATNTVTLTYTGTSPNGAQVLANGDYRVTIAAANVADAAGNTLAADHTFDFFFLMADANHDRLVNLGDFNILAANFGQSNRDFTQADFNYDGLVNLADFNILASRFGTGLAPSSGSPFGDQPIGERDSADDEELLS